MGQSDPEAAKLSQKSMISLCVKFQPYSTPPFLLIDFGEGLQLADPTELQLDGVGVDFVFPPSQEQVTSNK